MPGHGATIGMTGSGKSTLEHVRAAEFRRRRFGVLVADPHLSPPWCADFITRDLELLYRVARNSRRCAIFIEEAGDFAKCDHFAWFFTQARHLGHVVQYVSQYYAQVPPLVRTNCERLCLFRVGQRCADVWAEDFAQPEIATLAAGLARHEFVDASRYGTPRVCKLRLTAAGR